jgi:hypothetical protein
MHRFRTLPFVLLMCAAVLLGCSDDNPKKAGQTSSPTASSSSASPSESPTDQTTSPSPSPASTASKGPEFPTDRIEAASMHKAVLESTVAQSPAEKAAVAAWMDYWQGAADTYYSYKASDGFNRVARGSAKQDVLGYTSDLMKKHNRVVGWAKDNVTKIDVSGDTATVKDCTKNFTFTVDEEAEPLTRPPPWYAVTGTLKKENGQWTVTTQVSKQLKKSCLS